MRIGVIGAGLIGGSVLRAGRAAGFDMTGCDTDPVQLAAARDAGFTMADSPRALTGADVIVLAVPLPSLRKVLPALADFDGIVTDVISVKRPVVDAVAAHGSRLRFVPGHPMAGKEKAGFAAASDDLFDGRMWALCPGTDRQDDWMAVAAMACRLGARVVPTGVDAHDHAVARISHLPHLLANALACNASDGLAGALAAGSFADGTRVAASPSTLVAAMCGGNAGPTTAALDELTSRLDEARAALTAPDPIAALRDWLATGHTARTGWPPRPGPRSTVYATGANLLAIGDVGGWIESVDPAAGTVIATHPDGPMP